MDTPLTSPRYLYAVFGYFPALSPEPSLEEVFRTVEAALSFIDGRIADYGWAGRETHPSSPYWWQEKDGCRQYWIEIYQALGAPGAEEV